MANATNEDDPNISAMLRTSTSNQTNSTVKPNLKGDWLNFYLLMLLYTLQGLPLGLSTALPIIFQSTKLVSFDEQAFFSFVRWPYSMKLLWAPIVDALYVHSIGRRKSWLIPIQYVTGALLLCTANNIDLWLPETGKPNVKALTYMFFVINFLSATQDIVVDGWALTMLKKKNVSYASTCNLVGFSLGIFFGSVCSILLTSEEFHRKLLWKTSGSGGIITMKSFLFFWGILFMLITTLVGILKREKDNRLEDNYVKINVFQNYKLLWDVLKLPSIKSLAIAMLTLRMGFAATFGLTNLKLIEAGVPKDDTTIVSMVSNGVHILIPLVISKYTSGPKPLSVCLKTVIIKLFWGLTNVVLIYYTPKIIRVNGEVQIPMEYYFLLGFVSFTNETLSTTLMLAVQSFFSRISDPRFGGTYMTLLNTVMNLGSAVTVTIALKLVNFLTFKKCLNDTQNSFPSSNSNNTSNVNTSGCVVVLDGYYVEFVLCLIIGFTWYGVFKNILKKLQTVNSSSWLVYFDRPNTENAEELIVATSKP